MRVSRKRDLVAELTKPKSPPVTFVPDWSAAAESGDKHKSLTFAAAATVTLNHNLGKNPSVTVVDSAGTEWVVEVEHLSTNTCRFTLAHPFSGTAYFN